MTTFEVARLVGELLGVMVFMGTSGAYVVRQIWRLLDSVDALTKETKALTVASTNMTVRLTEHAILDESRYLEISNRLSRIEGRLGLPPDNAP